MNDLKVVGKQVFMGKEINIIEGGFGEGQKVILAKTIAEIHEMRADKINALIRDNIDEFEDCVDLVDLKNSNLTEVSLLELGFSKQVIANSNNIYLLSEQGYMLLVGFMRTDKAKEIRKQMRREYFTMRQVINSDEQKKKELAYQLMIGGIDSIEAHKRLVEIETKPLIQKIEHDAPKVNCYEKFINDDGTYTTTNVAKMLGIKPKDLFAWLRGNGLVYKKKVEATISGIDKGYLKQVVKGGYACMVVTPSGVEYIENNFVEQEVA